LLAGVLGVGTEQLVLAGIAWVKALEKLKKKDKLEG
jgi:hypothetical protein